MIFNQTTKKNGFVLYSKIFNKVISLFKNSLVRFLVLSFIFFLFWDLIVYQYLLPYSFQEWVIKLNGTMSKIFLYAVYKEPYFTNNAVYINNIPCVYIGIPCNGVGSMGIISCVILASRATWLQKFWFIIANCLFIFIFNSLRISVLAALLYEHKQSFDINHKYIFNILLYAILLLLFSSWSQKINKTETCKDQS